MSILLQRDSCSVEMLLVEENDPVLGATIPERRSVGEEVRARRTKAEMALLKAETF